MFNIGVYGTSFSSTCLWWSVGELQLLYQTLLTKHWNEPNKLQQEEPFWHELLPFRRDVIYWNKHDNKQKIVTNKLTSHEKLKIRTSAVISLRAACHRSESCSYDTPVIFISLTFGSRLGHQNSARPKEFDVRQTLTEVIRSSSLIVWHHGGGSLRLLLPPHGSPLSLLSSPSSDLAPQTEPSTPPLRPPLLPSRLFRCLVLVPPAWAKRSSWSVCGAVTRPASRGTSAWRSVCTRRRWTPTRRTASCTATAPPRTWGWASTARRWTTPSRRGSSTPSGQR